METYCSGLSSNRQIKLITNRCATRILLCILGAILLFSVSSAQTRQMPFRGKNLAFMDFIKLSYSDRVTAISYNYKDTVLVEEFLKSVPPEDIDSMLATVNKRIELYKKRCVALGFTDEQTNIQTMSLYKTSDALKIIKPANSNIAPKQKAKKKTESAETQFKNSNIEEKMNFLSFIVNMPEYFNKFYTMLTPSEKDSTALTVDQMISNQKLMNSKTEQPQEITDKKIKRYTDLKVKLQEIKKAN